jgi:hypothetical protein
MTAHFGGLINAAARQISLLACKIPLIITLREITQIKTIKDCGFCLGRMVFDFSRAIKRRRTVEYL